MFKIELMLDESCISIDGSMTRRQLLDAISKDPKWFVDAAETVRIISPIGCITENRG